MTLPYVHTIKLLLGTNGYDVNVDPPKNERTRIRFTDPLDDSEYEVIVSHRNAEHALRETLKRFGTLGQQLDFFGRRNQRSQRFAVEAIAVPV